MSKSSMKSIRAKCRRIVKKGGLMTMRSCVKNLGELRRRKKCDENQKRSERIIANGEKTAERVRIRARIRAGRMLKGCKR